MPPPRIRLVSCLVVLLSISCGPSRLSLELPPEGVSARDFRRVRDSWTRRHEVYQKIMEGRLFVTATYFAPEVRQAWLAVAEEAYGWDGQARVAEESRVAEDDRLHHTFFVAVSTYDWRWNRLHAHDSPWRLWLEDDSGRRAEPVDIERVRARRPEFSTFFPYLDSFSEGYLVRFKRAGEVGTADVGDELLPRIVPGTREFTLRVTGAPATATLTWNLE